MLVRLGPTRQGMIAGLALLAGGGVAGAVIAGIIVDDAPTVTEQAVTGTEMASARTPLSSDGPLRCSTYDVPTFESAVTPRSTLIDGSPYVIVCDDSADQEVLGEPFIYRESTRCLWTSDVDQPVLPPPDPGPPPTPDSMLTVEACDGHPTGNMVWSPSPERRE